MPTTRAFCYRCFKPTIVCVCTALPTIANRTQVHIVQHPRERNRPIGTLRFAQLGLQWCQVEVNPPWTGVPAALADQGRAGMALLYPSSAARSIHDLPPAEKPTALVVLDGTWSQVKALLRNNPWLAELPHVCLAAPEPSRYRIRAEPQRHYLSTLEAIVGALRVLEPDTTGFAALLQAFDAMIDAQIAHSTGSLPRRRVRRPSGRYALPAALTQTRDHHVLLHVQTVGAARQAEPIQVCALRVATGAQFECLIRHDAAIDARKCVKLGLTTAQFSTAVDESVALQLWQAFLQADDVVLAWHPRAVAVWPVPVARTVLLKAVWCNLEHAAAGHLTDVLAELGVAVAPADFSGWAGRVMGELRAMRLCLLARDGQARPAPGDARSAEEVREVE